MAAPTRRVTRKLELVDPATGEVEDRDATWDEPGRGRRKGRKMSFTMTERNVMQLRLTGAEWTVLNQFIYSINPETGKVSLRIADVAELTGFRAPNVSRIVASLRDRKILFRESAYLWRVNNHIAYKGEVAEWSQAYYQDPEPVWEV